MKRTVAILIIAAALTGCAHKPGLGSWADAGSTYAALSGGGFTEANPLLSWAPTPAATALASLGLKQGAKYALTWAGTPPDTAHHGIETAGTAAAGWNLALLAGASSLLSFGVAALAGYGYIWLWAP